MIAPRPLSQRPTAAARPGWRATARVLAWACLALLLVAPTVQARDTKVPANAAGELEKRYRHLLKQEDFGSFNARMDVIRELGRLETPAAQAVLLRIVETSKRIDDEVVAMLSMGPALDKQQTLALARFIHRRGGPVRTHALGMSYAAAEDPKVLTWLAGPGLHCPNHDSHRAVIDSQTFHADPRGLERLQVVYAEQNEKTRSLDLAFGAVRAVGAIGAVDGDPTRAVRRFLLRTSKHPDFRIRLATAEAVAQQKPLDINLRGALRELLEDEQAVVRQAAAEGLGKAKVVELIPELADRLNDERIKTRDVAYAALVRITGLDLGYDASHWKAWFKNREKSEQPRKTTPYATESSYFGVQVHSDRVLFIVDLSGSMAFPWGQDTTRLDVARAELRKALQHLAPGTLFNIIAFSDTVKSWRRHEAKADAGSVKRALKWMDKVFQEPRGGTFMYAALEKAFVENPQVDTIFLLSDGLATDGEPIAPEAILASVSEWNRYRRVTIHTFALTLEDLPQKGIEKKDFDAVKSFMAKLARLTDGTTHVVKDLPASVKKTTPK